MYGDATYGVRARAGCGAQAIKSIRTWNMISAPVHTCLRPGPEAEPRMTPCPHAGSEDLVPWRCREAALASGRVHQHSRSTTITPRPLARREPVRYSTDTVHATNTGGGFAEGTRAPCPNASQRERSRVQQTELKFRPGAHWAGTGEPATCKWAVSCSSQHNLTIWRLR